MDYISIKEFLHFLYLSKMLFDLKRDDLLGEIKDVPLDYDCFFTACFDVMQGTFDYYDNYSWDDLNHKDEDEYMYCYVEFYGDSLLDEYISSFPKNADEEFKDNLGVKLLLKELSSWFYFGYFDYEIIEDMEKVLPEFPFKHAIRFSFYEGEYYSYVGFAIGIVKIYKFLCEECSIKPKSKSEVLAA